MTTTRLTPRGREVLAGLGITVAWLAFLSSLLFLATLNH